MATGITLYMTEEETERVKERIRNHVQECRVRTGRLWELCNPRSLIQQAVSSSLVQDLAYAACGMETPSNSPETMVAYAVGRPYSPCTADQRDLQPMQLSDLSMETHHRGRMLSLLRVSPVVELKMHSWTVMQEKSSDNAERLEVFLHKSKHGQDILESGSEFIVKEPYYTLNSQGEPTIRIDHPSDLVVSRYADGPETWRNPNGYSTRVSKTAVECKEQGNTALQKQNYLQAHASYSEGLDLTSQDYQAVHTLVTDLYRNRSHVNLLLQRFDEAKADALSSLTQGEGQEHRRLDAKAYFRAGTAAYSLGSFEEAKGYFREQGKLDPDSQLAKYNLKRIGVRLKEKATGVYDLEKVMNSQSKSAGRSDVANFYGYTEVRKSPGAGRGLFATRDIPSQQIIVGEKAFCVVWGYESEAFSALTCDLRDDAAIRVFPTGLHRSMMQKLSNNPSQIEGVLDLYADYEGLSNKLHCHDGGPVVDTFQVHDIIQRNAFGPGQQTQDEDISNASTGIWIRASRINHSCVPNAEKSYVGDLMILRAIRKIPAGEEITQAYDESSDYEARSALLYKTWGFHCRCALCVAEEADGATLRKHRRELAAVANDLVQRENALYAKKMTVFRVKRLYDSLCSTYNEERYQGLPRPALSEIEKWLAIASP